LWHFYKYIYFTLVWFISLHYSPSSLTHFLKMTSAGFHVPYSWLSTSTILTILYPFHLPSPLTWPVLHSYPSLFVPVHCSVEFCLGILPVNILYFNQSNPLYYSSSPISLYPLLFNSFQCISLCLVPTQMWCISILLSFFFSSSLKSSPTFEYICIYDNACIYIWIYLHIGEKTCDLLTLFSVLKREVGSPWYNEWLHRSLYVG
jgi:hypothetical protein